MIKKFRKKPVVIEAIRFRCSSFENSNYQEITKWIGLNNPTPRAIRNDLVLTIGTLEDSMEAQPGDWIIKGIKGEFYSCKPDIFEATYEEVDDTK